MAARKAGEAGILERMGRGVGDTNQASSVLYGPPRPRRFSRGARLPGDPPFHGGSALPVDEHSSFRPLYDSIGLYSFVAEPSENEGFGGGRVWQALGPVPKAWTAYKSAKVIDAVGIEMLRRWRQSIVEARALGGAFHCSLGPIEGLDGDIRHRNIILGGAWSGCTVNADHFEAMSRVIGAGGHEVRELMFLDEDLILGCFDRDGTLVGMYKPARMRSMP